MPGHLGMFFVSGETGMLIIGHRGTAALEPENTLLSVSRALEIGVDAVEIDVRMTRDNHLVVIHDDTVDRTTDGTGRVKALDLGQIQRLNAGKGTKIPTLDEVFGFVGNRITVFVELKEAGTEDAVVELIRKHDVFDTTVVISFWHRLVVSAKQSDDRIKTGVLMVGCPVDTSVASAAQADVLMMKYTFVDKDFVDIAHRDGMKLFVWNVDQLGLAESYARMGVDGIGSNDPRALVNRFKS